MHTTKYIVGTALALTLAQTQAATVLFTDNFNVADATLDVSSSGPGRLGGTLATTVSLKSALTPQNITGGQLYQVDHPDTVKSGRVRMQDSVGLFNWASGATGAAILTEGTLRVEFDLTSTDTTSSTWTSFSLGFVTALEPGLRVNDAQTDYGILFENRGRTQRFDNGVKTVAGTFTPTASQQHVILDFSFSSFADGTNVDALVSIGGTQVDSYTFALNGNDGKLYMELGTLQTGNRIDNFSVSAVTVPSPYETWLAANGDLADTTAHFLAFAFGTGPEAGGTASYANSIVTPGHPTTTVTPGESSVDFRAVFSRRHSYQADGLSYTLQFSADLDFSAGHRKDVPVTDPNGPGILQLGTDGSVDIMSVSYPWLIETVNGYEKPTFFRVIVNQIPSSNQNPE